jgi:Txe/YoeB family toxin of Txe-Axe toxin-antitoxin module
MRRISINTLNISSKRKDSKKFKNTLRKLSISSILQTINQKPYKSISELAKIKVKLALNMIFN